MNNWSSFLTSFVSSFTLAILNKIRWNPKVVLICISLVARVFNTFNCISYFLSRTPHRDHFLIWLLCFCFVVFCFWFCWLDLVTRGSHYVVLAVQELLLKIPLPPEYCLLLDSFLSTLWFWILILSQMHCWQNSLQSSSLLGSFMLYFMRSNLSIIGLNSSILIFLSPMDTCFFQVLWEPVLELPMSSSSLSVSAFTLNSLIMYIGFCVGQR